MFNKYDAYKDSGVQWIGEIPSKWGVLRAKNLFNFRKIINSKYQCNNVLSLTLRGVVNNSFDNPEGLIPKDYATYQIFNKNDLVFKLIDLENISTSRVGLVHEKGIMSPAYIRLECKETVIPKFAYYYFYNLYLQTVFNKLGAGVRSTLSQKDLLELPYLHLCKEQQIKIVDFLETKTSEIEQAIAIKEQQIALLNERKQIVIQKAVTQGLNPNVVMKDSGVEWIGQIPEHWQIKKLKFICKSQGRIGFKGYSSDDLVDQHEGALTLGATHLNWNGEIVLDQPVYLSWKKYYESPEIMVKKDDILIVQRGSTCGKVAIVDKDYGRVTINPSLVLLKEFKENPYFCVEGIKVVLNGILNEVSKTAIPMISQFQINNIEIALPPQNEQMQIIEYINEIQVSFKSLIDIKFNEIEKLKEYKTTLINDAVTGKIKVA